MVKVKRKPIKETHEIECPYCKAILEYTDDDVYSIPNDYGDYLLEIVCPHCTHNVIVNPTIELKSEPKNEPKFPDDFFHFGTNDSYKLSNEETQKYINEVKNSLENAVIGEYFYAGTGDTAVFGFKHEDEDVITVAKNYYEWSNFEE